EVVTTIGRTQIVGTDYAIQLGNWAHTLAEDDAERVSAAMGLLSCRFSDTFVESNWDRWLGMGPPRGRYRCPGALLQAISRWRDMGAQELANTQVLKRAIRDTANEVVSPPLDDSHLDDFLEALRSLAASAGILVDLPDAHAARTWTPTVGRAS